MLRYLFTGLGLPEMALAINRVAVGLFFLLSGYHKLFNVQRHTALVLTLRSAGLPRVIVLQSLVPGAEFSGGFAVAIGPFCACGSRTVGNFNRRNARRRHQANCQLAANRQGRLVMTSFTWLKCSALETRST